MNQSTIQHHFPLVKSGAKRIRLLDDEDSLKKTIKKDLSSLTNKLKPLLTPISQIPALSTSTLSLINSLNLQKSSQTAEAILSSLPAKEKFADLLDPLRSFPLPYAYKNLVSCLEHLDKALNYFSLTKQPTFVSEVLLYIKEKCKFGITLQNIQQILYIYDAYELEFKPKCEKEPGFVISFKLSLELIDGQLPSELGFKRKQELHSKLLQETQKHHDEFLVKHSLEPCQSAWHPDFSLQTVPEISLAALPSSSPVKSILQHEIIPRNQTISSVFTDMQQNIPTPVLISSSPSLQIPPISPVLCEKKQVKNRLISLCEALKGLFASMKTPSIFYSNLVKKLSDIHPESSLKSDLAVLCDLFPSWISTISTNSGTVIRTNRSTMLSLKTIHEEIGTAFS
jgi:hypothetical protein